MAEYFDRRIAAPSEPVPKAGPAARTAGAPRSTSRRTLRDRRGRGLRSPLLPPQLPAARTRAQQFDHAVLEAVADLEDRWPDELASIEFAVDEVPSLPVGGVLPSSDVVLDGGVPLTRFSPPGVDSRGRTTKARVVVYRRPLEVRAADSGDLGDLVAEVLGEQLTAVLGEGSGGQQGA
jgi:hypothetical protein